MLLARARCAWSLVTLRHGFEPMTCTICIWQSTSRTSLWRQPVIEQRPTWSCAEWKTWLTDDGALAAAVNAERVAGFPNGRLFLDSVEQALAVALVKGYAVQRRSVQTHRGGLGSARLRRIKEFVDARIEDELTLCEMAQAVELSPAHFSRMFRKSTGETLHQFFLRQRVERAKEMLRSADGRVLDVAVACGFKSQQHFAQAFRNVCGASPTEYRQEFLHHEPPYARERANS